MDIVIDSKKLCSIALAELDNKEHQLLAQRRDIQDFVKSAHSSKETIKTKAGVKKIEQEIEVIVESLLDAMDIFPDFKSEADNLSRRYRVMKNHVFDMRKMLTDDLALRQLVENKKVIGASLTVGPTAYARQNIKNAFILVSKSICDIPPHRMKSNFLVYYAKEQIKENMTAVRETFRMGALGLKTVISRIVARPRNGARRSYPQKHQL